MRKEIPQSPANNAMTREQIEAIIEEKLRFYKTVAYAFALGLASLFIVLTVNQLLAKRSLLVYLHDQLFGSDHALRDVIAGSVALSYSDQFALKANDKPHYLYFYAAKAQTVLLVSEVKHFGPAEHTNKVLVTLDQIESPILDAGLQGVSITDITDHTSAPARAAPAPENVHSLVFQIDPRNADPNDSVDIRVIVNVKGLETGQDDSSGKKVAKQSDERENEK